MSGVKLQNVIKKYGDVQVIHGIDLEIADGEFCVFVLSHLFIPLC